MKIAVSILDCISRTDSVKMFNYTNIDYIHIDVMDGNFVSKVSFKNVEEIIDIDKISKYPLDIHLMVDNPEEYISKLKGLNVSYITFHLEVCRDIDNIIKEIKKAGYGVGISIKPGTDIEKLEPYLGDIDLVLVMSVEPGMGGQEFTVSTIDKVWELKSLTSKFDRDIVIEVDGGINNETIKLIDNIDIAVVGSYITKSDNYLEKVNNLRNILDCIRKE